jgi:hypothetical protein
VPHGLNHVPGPSFALAADHRGAFTDSSERLSQVGCSTYEWDGEAPLVDVMGLVGRRQNLGLVDVIDPEALEHLCLYEVADATLGHHRDRYRFHDLGDLLGVGHAHHPALGADVGGHALERHDRDRAGLLGDLRLVGGRDVHDDAAL